MLVILVGVLQEGTGNKTTLERIHTHLTHTLPTTTTTLLLLDARDPAACIQTIQETLDAHPAVCGIALHAFRGGSILQTFSFPYAVILGGTDINVPEAYLTHPEKGQTTRDALHQAAAIVAFSSEMGRSAKLVLPSLLPTTPPIHVIPPRILPKDIGGDGSVTLPPPLQDVVDSSRPFVLLLSSIRAVKDPAWVVAEWRTRCAGDLGPKLVILGPVLEDPVFVDLLHAMGVSDGSGEKGVVDTEHVMYHPVVEHGVAMELLSHALALVNTSISEGLSNAVLEASVLGIPLVLRNHPSNVAFSRSLSPEGQDQGMGLGEGEGVDGGGEGGSCVVVVDDPEAMLDAILALPSSSTLPPPTATPPPVATTSSSSSTSSASSATPSPPSEEAKSYTALVHTLLSHPSS